MAKRTVTELYNHHIGVQLGEVEDPEATADARKLRLDAPAVTEPYWTIVFTDRDTGDQIRVGMVRKGRDGLIRELTGGIVLAGGELPSV